MPGQKEINIQVQVYSIQVAVRCCLGLESGVQLQDIPPLSKGF